MKKYKNKVTIVLIIIIILQLVYKIYVDYTKEAFFIDEIYSYGLMNNDEAFIFEREDFGNAWHTGQYFYDYITINNDEVFNLSAVYKNQVEDVHPPIYYLLLRIMATFTIGTFTKWTGLILNLIIFVFCAIMVYKIGRNLLKNTNCALLLVILYGFSLFSMQNTTYIRMYQLLELNLLLLVYWHVKNFNKVLTKKELFKLSILVMTGFLTHYYYAIFAVGIYFVNMLQLIKEKQWKNILKYNLTLILSAIVAIGLFPACLSHILEGYRGKNSIKKFVDTRNLKLVWTTAIAYLKLIKNNMFNIDVKYIVIPILILIPSLLLKKRKLNDKIMYLAVPVLLYLAVIIKSSPFIDLRYMLPIIVFLAILLIYMLKNILQTIIKNRKVVISIMAIIVIIFSIPTPYNEKFEYIYYDYKENIEIIERYKAIPCIYLYNDVDITANNFVSDIYYLRILDNIYILSNETVNYHNDSVYDTMSFSEYSKYFDIDVEKTTMKLDDIIDDRDISNGILIFSSIYNYKIMSYILEKTNFNQIDEVMTLEDSQLYLIH